MGNKKCRIYAACGVSQTPKTTPDMRGEYSVTEDQKSEGYGKQYNIDQVVNIYSETDDVIETTRKFRESQKEAAEEW